MSTHHISAFRNPVPHLCFVAWLLLLTTTAMAAAIDTKLVDQWRLPFSEDAQAVVHSGNLVFVAASYDGLIIYDITAPHNPLRLGEQATTYAYDVAVEGNYAYIADYDGGLVIIDVSDPAAPSIASTLATNGDAYGVDAQGNLVFVALESSGMDIVNVSNPSAPFIVSHTPTDEYMYDITARGNHAFVADYSDGMRIYDVSNPSAPVLLSQTVTDDYVYDIKVVGDYAYLADQGGGLQIVDIQDLANPTIVGTHVTEYDAYGVFVTGNYAYVAVDYEGLEIVDITSKTAPARAGLVETYDNALDVVVHDGIAYVADYNSVAVINVSSPTNPVLEAGYTPLGEIEQAVPRDDLLFLACDESGVQIIDASNPSDLQRVGGILTSNDCTRLAVYSNWVYAVEVDGLYVFDVSSPEQPVWVGFLDSRGHLKDIQIRYPYAYTVDKGLRIIDIRDPGAPTEVGFVAQSNPSWLALDRDYAYITDGSSAIRTVDVLDPTNPKVVATFSKSSYARGLHLHETKLYVSFGTDGINILDATDPLNLQLLGDYNLGNHVFSTTVRGSLAFVADYREGLQIHQVSDPTAPMLAGSYDTGDFAKGITVVGSHAYLVQPSYGGVFALELSATNAPMITARPDRIDIEAPLGSSPPASLVELWNTGTGTLSYTVASDVPWITPSATSGSSTGEVITIALTYDTDALPAGFHTGTVTVAASGAVNTPYPIPVACWIEPDVVVITPTNPPAATEMVPYTLQLIATGGTAPYVWTASSDWPSGITNGIDGYVEGRAILAGTYPVNVALTDARGRMYSNVVTFVVAQNPNRPPVISATDPAQGIVPMAEQTNQLFSVTATDPEAGTLTYRWTIDGVGVATNPHSYLFTTVWDDAGTYQLDVQVSDGLWDNVYASWTIEVTDDNDGDGIPNEFENNHPLLDAWNPADGAADLDLDHLDNYGEFLAGTLLDNADTDSDSLLDGWEVTYGFDPLDPPGGLPGMLCHQEGHWRAADTYNRAVHSLTTEGNRLYAALSESRTVFGFRTFDISNPSTPVRLGGYNTGNYTFRGMVANGNYVYHGIETLGLHTFNVSNLSAPTRSDLDTAQAYGLHLEGGYLYVADYYLGLRIFSLANPAAPSPYSTLSAGSIAWGVDKKGDHLFMARDQYGMQVIDVSNPASPTKVTDYDWGGYQRAVDIEIQGDYAYIADGERGLSVIDISDPLNPLRVGGYNTPGLAFKVDVEGQHAFIADFGGAHMIVIDISDPTAPTEVGSFGPGQYVYAVTVTGDRAYVGTGDGLFSIRLVSEDTDMDGMNDAWETNQWQTLARTGLDDFDNDGIIDLGEFRAGLDPRDDDQDKDDIIDGVEIVTHNTNPFVGDSDGDGMSDGDELLCGTSPTESGDVLAGTDTVPAAAGDGIVFTWACIPGHRYQVEYITDLLDTTWLPASEIITATDYTCTVIIDAPPNQPGVFYRIVVLP